MSSMKWLIEGGIFYPINGSFKLYPSPGPGIFNLVKNPNPMDGRLGLQKVGDKFEFPFKIYDLGVDKFMKKVKDTWNNPYFEKKDQNLGIILNGLKGTGKTISAKLLCNMLEIPVIVVSYYIPGMLEFISSLEFECVVLIDEAEKTYRNDDPDASQILLKMIDGVTNKSRKLYILTTNTLNINENLIGRPGRIRYIQSFGNISAKAINEYIADNLEHPEAKESVLSLVESLEISTIDTLKAIVDEANIHGRIDDSNNLNLSIATTYMDMLYYQINDGENVELAESRFEAAVEFIKKFGRKDKPVTWSYLTKFIPEKHDRSWNWDDPVDEWEDTSMYRDEEGTESPEKKQVVKDLEKAVAAAVKGSSNKAIEGMPVEQPKPEEVHYMEDYLRQKFHVYNDTIRVKGTKLHVGMVTENYGEIYKEKDGWFYSHRGNREYRFLVQQPRQRVTMYRGELDY